MLDFNKFLIFADEAGDHLLLPHDPNFPLFVLVFCAIERTHYAEFIAPELLKIKLKYFQDSHIVFHEREIRKAEKDFCFLTNKEIRESFFNDLNTFIEQAKFTIIPSIILKGQLKVTNFELENPYALSTKFCLEDLAGFLDQYNEALPTTIAFEARGKKEDKELELTFLRLIQQPKFAGCFHIKIVPKISNCCGLQLADLIARPIGRYILNPNQPNKAFEIIKSKIYNWKEGEKLKAFP